MVPLFFLLPYSSHPSAFHGCTLSVQQLPVLISFSSPLMLSRDRLQIGSRKGFKEFVDVHHPILYSSITALCYYTMSGTWRAPGYHYCFCLGNASQLGAIYTSCKDTADVAFSRRDATKTAQLQGEGFVTSLTW